MSFEIRPGAAGDATALAAFAARTFEETFSHSCSREDMEAHLAYAYGTQQQLNELEDPDISTLLVEVDDSLAGFAQVRSGDTPDCVTGDDPLELWRFYIDRTWHGQGIAHALMKRVEEVAVRRGARTIWLGVWEHNYRAQSFYRKFNFLDAGSQSYLVGNDQQTDRIYTRPLPAPASNRL